MKQTSRILVTGGAGFAGSNLALMFKADNPQADVVALDNLRRRGSELALQRLRKGNVEFIHGDIRNPEDLLPVGPFDLLIECSAEPSVHSGYGESPAYVINANLMGTINCLESARLHGADVVFLSSSRVYPISALRALPLEQRVDRLTIAAGKSGAGWSENGITTEFPLAGSRSIYGATKLASEIIIEEYVAMYGLRAVINRCGVLTGPWQMGKIDQGFVVLWAARHVYGGNLSYMGFGGEGTQVRDILHIVDLYDLIKIQIGQFEEHGHRIFNVGGGSQVSVSLVELTRYCHDLTGRSITIARHPKTRPADIPYYLTDTAAVTAATSWTPRKTVEVILKDIVDWLTEYRNELEPLLG